jgi:hypothetical protein
LLGGIVGVIEAFIIISGIIYYAQTYLGEGILKTAILDSQITIWLASASMWVFWIVGLFL